MEWIELAIETDHDGVEMVCHVLDQAGIEGTAIEDPADIEELVHDPTRWDYIDADVLKLTGNRVVVKGYLPGGREIPGKLEIIRQQLKELSERNSGLGELRLTVGSVNDEDWAQNWKKYYKPMKIGKNIIIKPSWEEYRSDDGHIVIELDPGMAFGTGGHESTSLCIEMLEDMVQIGDRVMDIGCGSGILAITAAKLGAGSVFAYDISDVAVDTARKNVEINNVGDIVHVDTGNLLGSASGRADIIVANIIADTIMDMASDVPEFLKPGGIFIASGIITDRADEVIRAIEDAGMKIVRQRVANEWVAVAASSKG
jgi:ribosomal protein L11 methyltransferase